MAGSEAEHEHTDRLRRTWWDLEKELGRAKIQEITLRKALESQRATMTRDVPTRESEENLDGQRRKHWEAEERVKGLGEKVQHALDTLLRRSRQEVDLAVAEAVAGGEMDPLLWRAAKEAVLNTVPERVAWVVANHGGRREVGRHTGISYTYLARLVEGRRPTDGPLAALADSYPDVFPEVNEVLRHAPQAGPRAGRPMRSKSKQEQAAQAGAPAVRLKLGHYTVDGSGQPTLVGSVFKGLAEEWRRTGADRIVRVESDEWAPRLRRGDIVVLRKEERPTEEGIYLVADANGSWSFRHYEWDLFDASYTALQPGVPALNVHDADVLGHVVYVLRAFQPERLPTERG